MKGSNALIYAALFFITISFGCDAIPKRHFENAERKWTEGDYKGALKEYEKIIEDYPKSTVADDAYYWMGVTYYLSLNRIDDALNAFQNLTDHYPGSEYFFQSQMYIAEIYDKGKGNYRLAIIEYQKIVEHAHDRGLIEQARFNTAEAYFKLGDINQARIEWELMINQTPDGKYTEEAYFRAAKTYFIQGRYQEAIEFYQKFLSKYPEGKLVHDVRFAIANCLEEQENLQEALQMYKKIENNYPNRDVIAKKIAALEKRMSKSH